MSITALFRPRNWFLIPMILLTALIEFGLSTHGNNSAEAREETPNAPESSHVNAAIVEFEPALAVRTSACITCHAKIQPSFITDFGYGDRYFFGQRVEGAAFGPFDGSIYGDFYGSEPNKTGWLTCSVDKKVVVPRAPIDFDLRAAGSKLAESYQKPLQAKSLAEYLRALEAQKPKPAEIIEKDRIFIGAPDAATLEARFQLVPGSWTEIKYVKSGRSSPDVQGIGLSPSKNYYTNKSDVVCDGDLFVRGTLFLNHMTLSTISGCRIYATGPIFVQNEIAYRNLGGLPDMTNLQLVSAKAILLGIGNKSCDSTYKDSPLSRRLISGYAITTFFTRDAHRKSLKPKENGQGIYEQGMKIDSLEDASCRDAAASFSRLLLNAPQVHGRYKGKFKGLVIAEVVLFRLGNSTFEFDPVFKQVPVLPRLKDSDYLLVQ